MKTSVSLPLTEVSASNVQVFVTKFVSKEVIAAILNSTQQSDHIFVTSYCPKHFVQMAFDKPLWVMAALESNHFEPNMLQTPKMVAVNIVTWIIAWKEMHVADLVNDAKSVVAFLVPANWDGRNNATQTQTGCQVRTVWNRPRSTYEYSNMAPRLSG